MRHPDHRSQTVQTPNPSLLSETRLLGDIFRSETIGGTLALLAAAAALVWANTDYPTYRNLQDNHLGPLSLAHWAADGGLALFFFVAGLELKREFVTGSLRDRRAAIVPVAAACGGVALPALIYLALNVGSSSVRGWAIPAPTDIAFALAALALLGPQIPRELRIFLLTLAVVDDLIVITIIAVGYTQHLSIAWLAASAAWIAASALVLRSHWTHLAWFAIPFMAAAWWCMLASGVHATVAGIAIALLTPITPLGVRLEHALTPWSAGLIVPAFAFTSAGVALDGSAAINSAVFWGVALGFLVGKPCGIVAGALAAGTLTRTGTLPLRDLIGIGLVSGIGFTVALLVSDLAFEDSRNSVAKTAVLVASMVAALCGLFVLAHSRRVFAATNER